MNYSKIKCSHIHKTYIADGLNFSENGQVVVDQFMRGDDWGVWIDVPVKMLYEKAFKNLMKNANAKQDEKDRQEMEERGKIRDYCEGDYEIRYGRERRKMTVSYVMNKRNVKRARFHASGFETEEIAMAFADRFYANALVH